jgi:hypothetical protein
MPEPLFHQAWKDRVLLRPTGYPASILDRRKSREAALAA